MTDELPDYTSIEPPEETAEEEYTHHERRAEILRLLTDAGSPSAIKQTRLADRYGVHDSTISRDMDRLRESVAQNMGNDAKLLTRVLFEKTVQELQAEGEWKDAWDVVMDWNDWLADLGEQHREPNRSELGVDVRSRQTEVSYTVVREGDQEDLPETEEGVDYAELGFTSAPAEIEVEPADGGQADE